MNAGGAKASRESLAGLIELVTYHLAETGFAVLRVKVAGHRDLVTVVGSLPTVNAGEWLVAEGQWVQDREHGRQFKAEQLHCSPPTSREGLEKYLGSGLIKGIGSTFARKLVARFGEEIFDIIDHYSARLEEVEGIGPERRRRIKAAWNEQKAIREIMVFLYTHGVSPSRATRIYRIYGDAAIERVRANPYALAEDIPGIGFKTADQVAQRVGIAPDSVLRISAGLTQALLEATHNGHCALPRSKLEAEAQRLLGVRGELVAEALTGLLSTQRLVQETHHELELIFHPALRKAEETIASVLAQAGPLRPGYPSVDVPKAIDWCQRRTGKELAAGQREAIALALRHRILVITGGPGVGKTTLIHSLLLILRAKGVRCLLCAPTGRAAKRLTEATGVEAKTIHRLLGFQPGGSGFRRSRDQPLDADLLIVDEVSMVDVPLMSRLLPTLPASAGLILVGDVDQLPSVGPGSVLRDIIGSGVAPVARLTEVFRQAAQSGIITAAHRINQGLMPEWPPKGQESDCYFIERDQPDAIAAMVRDLVVRRIPAKFGFDPIEDIQVLCPMNRGSLGMRALNERLQNELNPAREGEPQVEQFGWTFRVGDKVLQTENNYNKEVFNGDIGRVHAIDPLEHEVTVRFDGRLVIYDFGELDELLPAYAMTIHKAQGSEFPAVIIPLATQHYLLLQRNLIYTGLTRGRKLVVLVGQKKALALAVHNARAAERYSGLRDRLQKAAAL